MARAADRPMRERIERAMMTLALIMEDDGEVYAPIFERLEQEMAALERRDSAVERARRLARSRALLPQTSNPAGGL